MIYRLLHVMQAIICKALIYRLICITLYQFLNPPVCLIASRPSFWIWSVMERGMLYPAWYRHPQEYSWLRASGSPEQHLEDFQGRKADRTSMRKVGCSRWAGWHICRHHIALRYSWSRYDPVSLNIKSPLIMLNGCLDKAGFFKKLIGLLA